VSRLIARLLLFTNGHIFSNCKVVPGTQGTTWTSLGFRQPETVIAEQQKLQPPTHQPNSGLAPLSIFPSNSSETRNLPNYPTQHLIPEEDPQRTLDSADDDEDDDAVGDGLGDEDGEPDNEDEGDDELDCREEGADAAETRNANPPRRPLPNWLLKPFKARVAESSSRDAKGLPPLYAHHQTFWFPRPSTFFLLRKQSTPQELFSPRFFLWDPDALCPKGIPCPNCQTTLQRHHALADVSTQTTPFGSSGTDTGAENVSILNPRSRPSLSVAGIPVS
jgi:hypothetical protein